MFESLEARVGRAAEARAASKRQVLAEQLRELLPSDIRVEPADDGVRISGPRLGEKMMLDASLRWTIAGLLK